MEYSRGLGWTVSAILVFCAHFLRLSAQEQGFISIDCGGQGSVPYTDENGLIWTPDSGFMQAGAAKSIEDISAPSISKPLTTVRYFTGNQKNCYALQPLSVGRPYLLRASFLYGNYDGLGQLPISFDILLNADLWASVIVSDGSLKQVYELYVLANSTFMSVCLARSGADNPFISSLEVRPFANNMNFMYVLKDGYVLSSLQRINYGAESNQSIRYPDDKFDRLWYSNTLQPSTSAAQKVTSTDNDQPPSAVLKTAFGTSTSVYLSVTYSNLLATSSYFLALYFAELGDANKEGERVFQIYLNGQKYFDPIDVFRRTGDQQYRGYEVYSPVPLNFEYSVNLTLTSLPNSTYGPLICAAELLKISNGTLSVGTLNDDVEALADVMKSVHMTDWIGDPCLPETYKYDWLTCSSTVPPRITALMLSQKSLQGSLSPSLNLLTELNEIHLDGNSLTGTIPDLSQLQNLQKLDLQNNNISGSIPGFLATLPKLSELLLQNNNLSGPIPSNLLQKATSSSFKFSFNGNGKLCGFPNATCTPEPHEDKKKSSIGRTIGLVVGVVVVALLGGITAIYFIKRRIHHDVDNTSKMESSNSRVVDSRAPHMIEVPHLSRVFTYEEVKVATKDFSRKIGQGGFGKVFHGVLPNGEQIAVKVLSKNSMQGVREFLNEVDVLSRVHHRNLVSLVGYSNNPERILIYEYMAGGSLQERLYSGPNQTGPSLGTLPWKTRLLIAVDAAQGLEYLHTGCNPSIIHRDVKSSNVLLSDRMQAKMADFGLSRFKFAENASHVSTNNIVGTAGYLDPEYHATLQMTHKSDVYSFGVILLELICGRPPVETFRLPPTLVDWIRPYIQRAQLQDVVDPALGRVYNLDTMWKVAEVAIMCTERHPSNRPTMDKVVSELKEAIQIEEGRYGISMDSMSGGGRSEGSSGVLYQPGHSASFRASEDLLSLRPR